MTKVTRIRRKKQAIDLGEGVEVVVYYEAANRPTIRWDNNRLMVVAGSDVMSDPTFAPVFNATPPAEVPRSSASGPITAAQQELLKSRGYFEDKAKKENPSLALFRAEGIPAGVIEGLRSHGDDSDA